MKFGLPIKLVEDMTLDEICHSGTPHEGTTPHSGRFPWGSGENAFQRPKDFYGYVKKLRNQGIDDTDIAKVLNLTTTELRKYFTVSKETTRKEKVERARELAKLDVDEDGKKMTNSRIGEIIAKEFGDDEPIRESTIRLYLDPTKNLKTNVAKTAEFLMEQVDKKGLVDVGDKVDKAIGVTRETMNSALAIAESKGYVVVKGSVPQVSNSEHSIPLILLGPPGTEPKEAYQYEDYHTLLDYMSEDGGVSFRPSFEYPVAINKKRVMIRYAEEGGKERDGEIQIRPGVKDLSLGGSHYAQVRILVDNGGDKKDLYLKGMAVYSNKPEEMPDGVDIIFNTNKSKDKPFEKVLKSVDDNLKKDPNNPFGSTIKERGGQSYYDNPRGKYTDPITGRKQSLSAINKRQDQGDWNEWEAKIASQMLAKQPIATINKQISKTIANVQAEYDEIMSLENPTVKAKLLEDFAGNCDTAARELKMAPFVGMSYHVILPLPSLKNNEIFAPSYKDGTQLALIRYPHGGKFEIPILTVNNKNVEGREVIGLDSYDAVGINSYNASILSGADFDGDTVMVIPTNNGITKIENAKPLKDLEGFETSEYGPHETIKDSNGDEHYFRYGVEYSIMSEEFKQKQMGIVSNLITDMTLKGATSEELARAVKHSMVVIDAVKHKLDYRQSEYDNKIKELHQKYQKHDYDESYGGASTLISRAKNPARIRKRELGAFILDQEGNPDNGNELEYYNPSKQIYRDKKTGKLYDARQGHVRKTVKVDPETGESLYHETKDGYLKIRYRDEDGKKIETAAYELRPNGKYRRPRYLIEEDDAEALDNLYYKVTDEDGSNDRFIKFNPAEQTLIQNPVLKETPKMDLVSDANLLSSGTVQEAAYAKCANKMKEFANEARKNMLYFDKNPIPYSSEARLMYFNEWKSLEAKVKLAELNAPRERAANVIATANIDAIINASEEELTKEDKTKLKQKELVKARIALNSRNARFDITEKEWEAVQAGAFSVSRLKDILRYADQDVVRQLATPRTGSELKESDVARIKSLARNGASISDIATRMKVSISTIQKCLKKE